MFKKPLTMVWCLKKVVLKLFWLCYKTGQSSEKDYDSSPRISKIWFSTHFFL